MQGNRDQQSSNPAERKEYHYQDALSEQKRERLEQFIVPRELPIGQERERVMQLLRDAVESSKNIVLIQGETGSGKSVLLPGMVREILKECNLPRKQFSVQPRIAAAHGISEAIAAVEDMPWGRNGAVGTATSEARETSSRTEISVVTTGVALRYLSEMVKASGEDPSYTPPYGAIIVDEFHEGSVDYHLIMGMIKVLRERGVAPLVVMTSATLDKDRVQEYYSMDDDQYARIEGRSYPVETRTIETFGSEEKKEQRRRLCESNGTGYITVTADVVREIVAKGGDGDILVFMPGKREIEETIQQIGSLPNVEVLPLHGALSPAERDNAITGTPPAGHRRVIVATNIAETSLTLPRVTTVVDSCRRRSVRFNPKTGIRETGTTFVSKDSAQQRAGRAGRVRAGQCVRVITQEQWEKMPEHTESEIRHASIEQVVLRLRNMGMTPEEFPFIEPPSKEQIMHAEKLLMHLGATDADGAITEIGQEMISMPFLEPRQARLVLEAKERGCFEAAVILATMAREGKSIFVRPREKANEADSAHAPFRTGSSDWFANLAVFRAALDNGLFQNRNGNKKRGEKNGKRGKDEENGQSSLRKWCYEKFINHNALRHVASHIGDFARAAGQEINRAALKNTLDKTDREALTRALLAGYADHLLYAANNTRGMPAYYHFDGVSDEINLSPGSAARGKNIQLCFVEKITEGRGTRRGYEITRNYGQLVHPVTVADIRDVAPHMLQEYIDGRPYYDQDAGTIVVNHVTTPKRTTMRILERVHRPYNNPDLHKEWARVIVDDYHNAINLPFADENKHVYNDNVKPLIDRFGPHMPISSLIDWYTQKLNKIAQEDSSALATIDGIKRHSNQLILRPEDIIPRERMGALETFYPTSAAFGQRVADITYEYQRTNTAQWHRAFAEIDYSDVDVLSFWQETDLLHLDDAALFAIGTDDDSVESTYKIQLPRQRLVSVRGPKHMSEIIARVDDDLRTAARHAFMDAHEQRTLGNAEVLDETTEIPKPQEQPVAYYHTADGETLYMYPGIVRTEIYDDGYKSVFQQKWFASEEEARQAYERTIGGVLNRLREEREREEQRKRLKEEIHVLARKILNVLDSDDGIPQELASDDDYYRRTVQSALNRSNANEHDKRHLTEIYEQIVVAQRAREEALANRETFRDRVREQWSDIKVFLKRAEDMARRGYDVAFSSNDIDYLRSYFEDVKSYIETENRAFDIEQEVQMQRLFKDLLTRMREYKQSMDSFATDSGMRINALADAFAQAGLGSERFSHGDDTQERTPDTYTESSPQRPQQKKSKKEHSHQREKKQAVTLPEEIMRRIGQGKPDERYLAILEEQEALEKERETLETEGDELARLLDQRDELRAQHNLLKKERTKLDKQIRELTQRKADKQRAPALHSRRRDVVQKIRDMEEGELKRVKSADTRLREISKHLSEINTYIDILNQKAQEIEHML